MSNSNVCMIAPSEREDTDDADLEWVCADGERAEAPDSIWSPAEGTALFSITSVATVSPGEPPRIRAIQMTRSEERRLQRALQRAWNSDDWEGPLPWARFSPCLTPAQTRLALRLAARMVA